MLLFLLVSLVSCSCKYVLVLINYCTVLKQHHFPLTVIKIIESESQIFVVTRYCAQVICQNKKTPILSVNRSMLCSSS